MSSKGSNKAQKTHHEGGGGGSGSAPPTLVKALLKEAAFLRNLVEMTSVPQTFRLLTTCKELLAVEKDVFEKHKLPVVCDMMSSSFGRDEGNGFKLYRAMVGTPNSRWMEWLDTSGVEELILPSSVTDEEMLIMFSDERFSKLRTLDFQYTDITDASVMEVARRCSNLQTLNLRYCRNITDASVLEVARRCSNIQSLNLGGCGRITDASVMEVGRRCSNLQTLIHHECCSKITDASLLEVARGCSNLQTLDLGENRYITDASVLEVARGCSNLQTLDLEFCRNITSACKDTLRQSHPQLDLEVDSSSNEEDY